MIEKGRPPLLGTNPGSYTNWHYKLAKMACSFPTMLLQKSASIVRGYARIFFIALLKNNCALSDYFVVQLGILIA